MTSHLRVAGVPEHFNYPWQMALDDGAFAAAGIALEFIDCPGGTGAMAEALNSGAIDAALVLTEGAVLDIARGGNNRLVKVYVESPLTWGIHVAAGSDIVELPYAPGTRVAISRHGSGSHLIAVVDALERGLAPGTLNFVVVDNLDGARHALADGNADIFLWEKHMTQPLVDRGEFRRIGEREVPWPAFVASVRRDVLDRVAAVVRRALDIAADYAVRLRADPGAAQRIAHTYAIEVSDAAAWLTTVRWNRDDYAPPTAALDRVIAALIAQGAIEGPAPPLDRLWYPL